MAIHEVIARLGEVLQPLAAASADRRAEILAEARLVRFGSGQAVFEEGNRDDHCMYLVKGSVDTFSGGQRVKRIDAGTPAASVPLPDEQPRRVTARAATDVGVLLVPRSRLGPLLRGDEKDGLEVQDIEETSDTGDWMTMLLRSPLYARLPVANIQRIMATMEQVAVKPGDIIVRQGEIGDFFYFLSKGRARVFRQAREGEPPVLLAELREGVSFGEEALVAGIPRNATVTMTTDGWVMRLAKHHFEELILDPTLNRLDWVAAETMVNDGAQWIDVRFPDEFEKDGLEGAVNIPLGMLRMRMPKLDRDKRYIIYCDNGQRSAAGGFLMAGSGFDVYVLEDGITTPELIDTMDAEGLLGEMRESSDPAAQLGRMPESIMGDAVTREPDPPAAAPSPTPLPENALPDNTVGMTQQLRSTIESLRADKASVESRVENLESELGATREALKAERLRAREMVREMQHMRQTLTDIQRKSHAALERERSAYEKELGKAVDNLQQALAEKETELEVERARNAEEIARLRSMLGGDEQAAG